MIFTNLLKMDGFDDCIVGVCERYGMDAVIAYDKDKVIDKLVTRDGMTRDEAEEFFSYNQIGAWMGEKTPVFVTLINKKLLREQEEETSCPRK
jgi:hypothetical protein